MRNKLFVLVGVALTIVGLVAWSLWLTKSLDAFSKDFALTQMPNYALTPEIYGTEIVVSDFFVFSSFEGLSFEERLSLPPNELLGVLVKSYEGSGMQKARLVFRAGPGERKPYAVDFVGCQPGDCKAAASSSEVLSLTQGEWEKVSVSPPSRLKTVSETVHLGSKIELYLSINEDIQGRLVEYTIYTVREPRGVLERLFKVIALGTPGPNINKLQYKRNVVLEGVR